MSQMQLTADQAVTQYQGEEYNNIVLMLTNKIARMRVQHTVELNGMQAQLDSALRELEEYREGTSANASSEENGGAGPSDPQPPPD